MTTTTRCERSPELDTTWNRSAFDLQPTVCDRAAPRDLPKTMNEDHCFGFVLGVLFTAALLGFVAVFTAVVLRGLL